MDFESGVCDFGSFEDIPEEATCSKCGRVTTEPEGLCYRCANPVEWSYFWGF